MVAIERFDISQVPDHKRPRVMEMRHYKSGTLAVHCSREDGSLWLFALGPRGGDRGHVVVPIRRADELAVWLDGDLSENFVGGAGLIRIRDGSLVIRDRKATKVFAMQLDEKDQAEFATCLREWVRAVPLAAS